MTTMTWGQAQRVERAVRQTTQQEYDEAINEVISSDFQMLDANDVHHYAQILGVTANEVRHLNMDHTGATADEMLTTFEDDDTDDILSFYN